MQVLMENVKEISGGRHASVNGKCEGDIHR